MQESSIAKFTSAQDLQRLVEPQSARSKRRLDFVRGVRIIETEFLASTKASSTLIVWFTAALNRQVNILPAFAGPRPRFQNSAHQISIADPTLGRYPDLRLTWYLGDPSHDLQAELAEFVSEIAQALAVRRIVFVGASAGGFGALALARKFPNSCAVALQPQIIISNHRYYQDYINICWPEKGSHDLLSQRVNNLCDEYAAGFDNAFIYVQGIADKAHFWDHCAPFMNSVRESDRQRAIFHVDFWGKFGHAQIPGEVTSAWILSAVKAKGLNANDLLQNFDNLRSAMSAPRSVANAGAAFGGQVTKDNHMKDTFVAASNMVRDHLLGNSGRMAP